MFSVGDVLVRLGVNVFLGQAKVDDVDDALVGSAIATEKEVLWLHVAVDQVFAVHILNSCNLEGGREGGREGWRGWEGRGKDKPTNKQAKKLN